MNNLDGKNVENCGNQEQDPLVCRNALTSDKREIGEIFYRSRRFVFKRRAFEQ